jgi:hypothetical protein
MNAKFLQISNVVRRGTRMVPKLQRLLMVVVSVGTVALVAPAAAHDTNRKWVDGQGYGQIVENHTLLEACDRRSDNWVVTTYATSNENKDYEITDNNGNKPGCGLKHVDPGEFVINARVQARSLDDPYVTPPVSIDP